MGNYDAYKTRVAACGATLRESRINSMLDMISSTFADSPSYFDVYINGAKTAVGVHIVDDSTSLSATNHNSKYIIMQPSDNLVVGDLITWQNFTWLCVACERFNDLYFKGKILKCMHTLNVYKNGVLSQVPACIENSVQLYRMGVDETRLMALPEGIIVLRVQDNATTALIKRSEVYRVGRQNYKVVDIQDAIEPGLLALKMEWSSNEPEAIPTTPPIQPIEISGVDSMIKDSTAFYTTDYESPVVFSIQSGSASIVSQANNSCTVKAGKEVGEVVLQATSGEIFGTKKIKIKGLL